MCHYNLSVGYSFGEATQRGNDFSRFNMRLNTDIHVFRGLDVRFDAAYSDVNRDLRDDGAPADLTVGTVTAPGFLSLIKSPFLSPYAYDVNGRLSHYLVIICRLPTIMPARLSRLMDLFMPMQYAWLTPQLS